MVVKSPVEGNHKVGHSDALRVVGKVRRKCVFTILINVQLERTLVFAYITGQFRMPVFKGNSQAKGVVYNSNFLYIKTYKNKFPRLVIQHQPRKDSIINKKAEY
jgi:hypothetical protein